MQDLWREDDIFDLQRMPGQMRATHIHPSTPYSTLTIHTIDHPFCVDPACSCHEQKEAIERVNSWVEQGLMTQDEATNFILGRTF
jgi:hypothetical protein